MRTTTVDRGGVPGHFARESSAKFASSPGNDAGGSDIPTGPNDTCELLTRWRRAGFTLRADGDRLLVAPASELTDELRDELRQAKPKLMALLRQSPRWCHADITRFTTRRDRLLRWGWAEPDAEALAERLMRRDSEQDDRVHCTDCKHYRPGRCGNHRQAGLGSNDLGRDLASLLQRCDGFKP
jgi:hypothetical protein